MERSSAGKHRRFLRWLGPRPVSLGETLALFIEGSPTFVELYLFVFMGAAILYALGFRSRITGFVVWLMMTDIYNRNALYLEGDGLGLSLLLVHLDLRSHRCRMELGQSLSGVETRRAIPGAFDRWKALDRGASWAWGCAWALSLCLVVRLPDHHGVGGYGAGVHGSRIAGVDGGAQRKSGSGRGYRPNLPAGAAVAPGCCSCGNCARSIR